MAGTGDVKPPFTLCVYCGSRGGTLPEFTTAAREVGQAIGERGWGLVYGGGRVGLMGVVADAALEAGAHVVGVIPQSLQEREVGHQGLSELHVVDTMHQRKQLMAQHADAFVALPGGIGTLEELFEVWTWRQLGYHDRPIGLLNTAGYFDPLIAFLTQTVTADFVSTGTLSMLQVGSEPAELLERLAARSSSGIQASDWRRT
jgi:uncharacterized protein (TIGR00730 family)